MAPPKKNCASFSGNAGLRGDRLGPSDIHDTWFVTMESEDIAVDTLVAAWKRSVQGQADSRGLENDEYYWTDNNGGGAKARVAPCQAGSRRWEMHRRTWWVTGRWVVRKSRQHARRGHGVLRAAAGERRSADATISVTADAGDGCDGLRLLPMDI